MTRLHGVAALGDCGPRNHRGPTVRWAVPDDETSNTFTILPGCYAQTRGESTRQTGLVKRGSGQSIHRIDGRASENRPHIATLIPANLLCNQFPPLLDANVSIDAVKNSASWNLRRIFRLYLPCSASRTCCGWSVYIKEWRGR